jgi:hypothetical protein
VNIILYMVNLGAGMVRARVLSLHRPDRLWGPPSIVPSRYRGLFLPGLERPGREADQSPPTSAEVKNIWISTSTPTMLQAGRSPVKVDFSN